MYRNLLGGIELECGRARSHTRRCRGRVPNHALYYHVRGRFSDFIYLFYYHVRCRFSQVMRVW
jgi:hypothetical protein